MEILDRCRRVVLGEPAFQRLVQALDLAAGLRVIGARVQVTDPERGGLELDRAQALAGTAVNTAPLSVSSEAGNPWVEAAPWNDATTSAALKIRLATEAMRNRE